MDNWDELAQKLTDNQYKTKFVKADGVITKLKARRDNVVISVLAGNQAACRYAQRHWSVEVRVIDKNGITKEHDTINQHSHYGLASNRGDRIERTPLQAVGWAIECGTEYLKDYEISFKTYKRASSSFTPYTFNDNVISADVIGRAYIDSIMLSCRVLSIVGITVDGKLDCQIIARPDEKPWFYIECKTHTLAIFRIISDGDGWHPVNHRTEKLTSIFSAGNSTLLFTDMSAIDRALIVKAIERHIA